MLQRFWQVTDMRLSISDERRMRNAIQSGGKVDIILVCGWILHLETTGELDSKEVVVHLPRSRARRKIGTFTGKAGACYADIADAVEEFEVKRA